MLLILLLLVLVLLIIINLDNAKIYSDDNKRPFVYINENGEEMLLNREQEILENFRKSIYLKDSFNATNALYLLNELTSLSSNESKGTIDIITSASLGNVPILHHLMNLYLLHKNPEHRRPLIDLSLKLIDYNANVSATYNKDPSLLFKSILVREMRLAKQLTEHGAKDTEYRTLSNLYSIACEPVPLAKLLLYADTFTRNNFKKKSKTKRIKYIKDLINGAFLPNSKPSISGRDMDDLSDTYDNVISLMGYSDSNSIMNDGIKLRDIISIITEVTSHTNKALIYNSIHNITDKDYNYVDDQSVDKNDVNIGILKLALALAESDMNGRNSFHLMAISRGDILISQIINIIKDNKDTKAFQRAIQVIAIALMAFDDRHITPIQYSNLRFKYDTNPMEELASLIGIDKEISPYTININKDMKKDKINHNGVLYNLDDYKTYIQKTRSENGDWDTSPVQSIHENTNSNTLDSEKCNIEEVWGIPDNIDYYILTSTPVIFRGAGTDSLLRKAFSKKIFIQRYGNDQVSVSTIPYAGSFGTPSQMTTLKEVADMGGIASLSSASPSYAFSVPGGTWKTKLQKDAILPSFLLESLKKLGKKIDESEIKSKSYIENQKMGSTSWEIQFYLGPAGSGAPVHFHGHAVNTLAYGQKKWFLFPPSDAFYSTQTALTFAMNDTRAENAITCTQNAGDIMFVPALWGHGTLNLKQSIGVAHEFSIESFCME